jgi:hypothetical protein
MLNYVKVFAVTTQSAVLAKCVYLGLIYWMVWLAFCGELKIGLPVFVFFCKRTTKV